MAHISADQTTVQLDNTNGAFQDLSGSSDTLLKQTHTFDDDNTISLAGKNITNIVLTIVYTSPKKLWRR